MNDRFAVGGATLSEARSKLCGFDANCTPFGRHKSRSETRVKKWTSLVKSEELTTSGGSPAGGGESHRVRTSAGPSRQRSVCSRSASRNMQETCPSSEATKTTLPGCSEAYVAPA